MLKHITPVILTFNEHENIARALKEVSWALDIVIVDSFSTDDTVDIARQFASVRVFQRKFKQHADQWNFAVQETGISTEWILALDADYIATPEFAEELARLSPREDCQGFEASFIYCVFGRPLSGTLYPDVTVLFRRASGRYAQQGHTQRLVIPGRREKLRTRLRHDDRKPLGRWLQSQYNYAVLEAAHILECEPHKLRLTDRIRRLAWPAPFLVLFYALVAKRCLFDGWPGWFYALQRALAEIVIAMEIIAQSRRDKDA